jgi:hypothetical protein
VTHLGITGHQSIPPDARDFVRRALRMEIEEARRIGQLWGVTSLADGADQEFAKLVLRAHGRLHVVIPSARYETTFDAKGLAKYETLLSRSVKQERLGFDGPSEVAFFAAGCRVVDLSDTLLAVWDGKPARGLGGTADVVKYAESSGVPVAIVWPAGVAR